MKKSISILLILSLCISLHGCSKFSTNIYNGINNKKLENKATSFDNTCINCFFIPNNEFRTPEINDKLNFKLRLYLKPKAEYPYDKLEQIVELEFVKIDDKHYGEG